MTYTADASIEAASLAPSTSSYTKTRHPFSVAATIRSPEVSVAVVKTHFSLWNSQIITYYPPNNRASCTKRLVQMHLILLVTLWV